MILFIKLLIAHLIADFFLQTEQAIKKRNELKLRSGFFYLHLLLHFLCLIVICYEPGFWKLAVGIVISHGIIDYLKMSFQNPQTQWTWFVGDQIAHLTVLAFAVLYWQNIYPDIPSLIGPEVIIIASGLIFLTQPASISIRMFFSRWPSPQDDSLEKAGRYIGYFERILIFIFVLSGHWEAVGFLLTAKSVFRFGDLRESANRGLTEYIMIGTMLSYGLALAVSLLCLHLLESTAQW